MNNLIKWLKLALRHPNFMVPYTLEKIGFRRMDDETYIQTIYMFRNGKKLDLKNPKTYTEKINWMKLYDRNPAYSIMVDKYAVKEYIANLIGKEYVIDLLGVWDSFDDIDFDMLPEKYVLKSTHDSHGVIIVDGKLDKTYAKKFFDERLSANFSDMGREWAYHDVKPRIIAEKYIEGLADRNYKLFCFDGKVKALYVAPWREATVDYFDEDFNHLDIITTLHQCAPTPPDKPSSFDKMKELAEKISSGYPAMRVDFYDVNGRLYFGEITFYHEAGFEPFIPDHWNLVFGEWINLPLDLK